SAGCRPSRSRCAAGRRRSNGEDLLFLRLSELVGDEDVSVGELLELRLEALHLVGGDTGALLFGLQLVVRVATEGADLDATVLHFLVEHLHEIAAALLVERRDVQTD